jgi:hypothetical protein
MRHSKWAVVMLWWTPHAIFVAQESNWRGETGMVRRGKVREIEHRSAGWGPSERRRQEGQTCWRSVQGATALSVVSPYLPS